MLAVAQTLVLLTLLPRVLTAPGSANADASSFAWVAATLTIGPLPTATPSPAPETPTPSPATQVGLPQVLPQAETEPTLAQAQAEGEAIALLPPTPTPTQPPPQPTQRPTAQPTPVPPPARPGPSGALSGETAAAIFREVGWPEAAIPEALSVACGIGNARWPNGESGCDPSAKNRNGPYYGLFQLWSGHAARFGYTVNDLYDPAINARIALVLWQENGWAIWDVKP